MRVTITEADCGPGDDILVILAQRGLDPNRPISRIDDPRTPSTDLIFEGEPIMAEATTHVFEGDPDTRQSASPVLSAKDGLFRKRYRALSDTDKEIHDLIKDAADELAAAIGVLNVDVAMRLGVTFKEEAAARALGYACDPAGVTLAIRHLEDAVYRAVKALTA